MKRLAILLTLTTPHGVFADENGDYQTQVNPDGSTEQVLIEPQGTYIIVTDQDGNQTKIDTTGQ